MHQRASGHTGYRDYHEDAGRLMCNAKPDKACALYARAHGFVRLARGPAKTYSCVGCGGPAKDWSLARKDIDETEIDTCEIHAGTFVWHIFAYVPRCFDCHQRYDDKTFWRAGGVAVQEKRAKEKLTVVIPTDA